MTAPEAHPIDERMLAVLERSFAHLAGADARIDAAELQKALGLRSEYLARRVLAIFDRDGDGAIDKAEFLASVRETVLGSEQDKLLFAFRLHDHDGDGALDRTELHRMIAIGLAEDDVVVREEDAERLVDTLLAAADRSGDGVVSFEELAAVMRAHPEVLRQITHNQARWIAPNEDLLARIDEPRAKREKRLSRILENRSLPILFVGVWAAANVFLFVSAVLRYRALGANEFVLLARGCGACINLNGALILVPMMRRMLAFLRTTFLARAIPIDDAIDFHRLVGQAMFGFGVVHSLAHLGNYALGTRKPFLAQLLHTKAGLSGLLLLLVFSVMWYFSRDAIRRKGRFELFYFTHLLYLTWLTLALAHGPVFWKWAGVPILGYALEQVLRAGRRGRSTEIVAGHALRSGVTRLELARPVGFSHRPGDYMFLRIPQVARREWHPFTISSAPERHNLTVHVRSLGNWTGALRRLIEERQARGDTSPLTAYVDGPYGTPSAHIFEARHVVLIGAGIGVTPFASVLESMVLRAHVRAERPPALRKGYFFWLNKDQYSFEWFTALLAHIEAIDKGDLIDVHICMTSGRTSVTSTALTLAREILHAEGHPDTMTGLRAKTEMGDPDWPRLLGEVARRHAPEPVDVYFCGPPGLAAKLRPVCAQLAMPFHEERF